MKDLERDSDQRLAVCRRDPFAGPCVVACLLQLATVDLTLRRYDTDGHRSDEHRLEEASAQRSVEAARLSSEDDDPAA